MLFAAGVIGGSLSGMVGGASLVTFPTLLAAGLPPVTAAASNVCSMMFANIARRVVGPRHAAASRTARWPA